MKPKDKKEKAVKKADQVKKKKDEKSEPKEEDVRIGWPDIDFKKTLGCG
ncbi:hypothetical protein [Marinoscillum sp. MHG1-6]|nr:hypothetical protein [Marinoscillum sp. MHG1-6]